MQSSGTAIPMVDLIIIVGYLIGIMLIGILVGYKKRASSEEFFLAGKSLRWPMIGAALFTANISTIHLVGLAADGYRIGLVVGNFEWMAAFTRPFISGASLRHYPNIWKNDTALWPEPLWPLLPFWEPSSYILESACMPVPR